MMAVEVLHAILHTHHRSRTKRTKEAKEEEKEEEEEEEKGEEEEGETAHIKSNNPHLTGGEIRRVSSAPRCFTHRIPVFLAIALRLARSDTSGIYCTAVTPAVSKHLCKSTSEEDRAFLGSGVPEISKHFFLNCLKLEENGCVSVQTVPAIHLAKLNVYVRTICVKTNERKYSYIISRTTGE